MEKVAIVTGAIRGIGLGIAKSLMKKGVRCVLTYFDWLDDLDEMHNQLNDKELADYVAVQVDLRQKQGALKAVETAIKEFGRLDILINNVERGGWPVVHGPYTQKQWQLEFETTVTAKWYLFTEAISYLKSSEDACVLNISSISGFVGRTGPAGLIFNDCYSLSNRAIGLLTEQWARIGAPQVRVNELCLGFFETRHGPKTRGWGLLKETEKRELKNHILLGRIGSIEEIVKAVNFLVFQATYMTGARIVLDGGYLLGAENVPTIPEGVVSPDEPTYGGSIPINLNRP